MNWHWAYAIDILPQLLDGLKVTLMATLLGSVIAMTLGLIIAIALRSGPTFVRVPLIAVTDFIRSTPLLVQLYVIFFLLPEVGITLTPFVAGIIGIGLHYSCYTAEVYRAGIENIPREQWEAAKSVNMSMPQTWCYVIIPQAVPPVVPGLANYVIGMFKETALLSAITVVELMTQAQHMANFTYRYIEPFTMVGIIFLLLSIPAAIAVKWIERHFDQRLAKI